MRNIILGTDWWTDCDDAVAVRVLSKFVKNGEINLKGVIIYACMEYSFASLKNLKVSSKYIFLSGIVLNQGADI